MRYQPVFHYPPWPLPHHIGRLSIVPFSYQSNIGYFTIFKTRTSTTLTTTTTAKTTAAATTTTTKPNQGFMQFDYVFAKSSKFTFCNEITKAGKNT